MTDQEIDFLEKLLKCSKDDLVVYYREWGENGKLIPIHSFQKNFKEWNQNQNDSEPVIWIGDNPQHCIALYAINTEDIVAFKELEINWPVE
jgi:hypothetical protein